MSEERLHQALTRYDTMCQAIAACAEVDEVKEIRNQAIAWEEYARQAKDREAEAHLAKIRIRAERKAGQLMKRMERSPGKRTDLAATSRPEGEKLDTPLTQTFSEQIEQHGISPKEARTWQDLADVPEEKFEQSLAQPGVPTTKGIISDANPKPPLTIEGVKPATAVFSDWLHEFEQQGFLETDPHALLGAMEPQTANYVQRLAPSVSDWLWQLQPAAPEPDAA